MQIETAWRNPKEQRPGALQKNQIQEVPELNPDAEPPCASTKAAIIVFGKQVGRTLTVCTDLKCPVHNPQVGARVAAEPPPTMPEAKAEETEEEAAQRQTEHQEHMGDFEAEQQRKKEERKAEFERQQQEHEAEQGRREKQRQARVAAFERIIEHAPPSFSPAQMRVFLRLFILMEPYSFLEEVASHFAGDENRQQTDEEIVLEALSGTADEKLTGLALRLVLSDHVGIPHETQVDLLTEAEQAFARMQPKALKAKSAGKKTKPAVVKSAPKNETAKKKAA